MTVLTEGPTARPGVTPTQVRPASIDRLEPTTGTPAQPSTGPGTVDPVPVARSRSATLHLAVDLDGTAAWVVRGTPEALAARVDDLRFLAETHDLGVAIPAVRRHAAGELWLDRWPSVARPPDPSSAGRYVAAAMRVALRDGTIVGTGEPHVLTDGQIGSVDLVVVRQLEPDERTGLASLWCQLVLLDAVGLTDAAARLCGSRPVGLAAAAERAVVSLAAEWTPVSLGLSFHHVARATIPAGPRAEPLVLLADELLHRLDLAHHHHIAVEALSSPTRALRLIAREAAWA